jgi:hypothetical protein
MATSKLSDAQRAAPLALRVVQTYPSRPARATEPSAKSFFAFLRAGDQYCRMVIIAAIPLWL